MEYPLLEDALNDMAVVRTTLETMDLFPAGDPVRAEMSEIILAARENLIRRLSEICVGLEADRAPYRLDYEKFKAAAVKMMTRGCRCRTLNSMMKVEAFDESSALYYYRLADHVGSGAFEATPAHASTVLVFRDMLHRLNQIGHFADTQTFTRVIFRKYIAILFLCYSTTDPMFYGDSA